MIKVIVNETNDCRASYASWVWLVYWHDEFIEITNEVSDTGWVNLFMGEDLIWIETADGIDEFTLYGAVDELERLFG